MARAIVDGKSVQFMQENLDGENVGWLRQQEKKTLASSEDEDGKTIFWGVYIGYQIDIVNYNVMSIN